MEFAINFESPLGNVIIRSDGQAVTKISFSENKSETSNSCAVIESCREQLSNYFAERLVSFDIPLNPEGTGFQKKVWDELLKIPYGETITYMELAVRLGDEKVIRAAGTANGKNPIAIIIPCHRVIGAGNKLTGYAGGIWRKKALLELEMKHTVRKDLLF
jgi:methylated-DNA-[protein]-cysteine S-methyltransferase